MVSKLGAVLLLALYRPVVTHRHPHGWRSPISPTDWLSLVDNQSVRRANEKCFLELGGGVERRNW